MTSMSNGFFRNFSDLKRFLKELGNEFIRKRTNTLER